MHRYHASSCTSAVNNSAIGGASRDASRSDSSSLPPNYSLSSRRPLPPTPYKLRCEKEPLNSRLGPPDFQPQTPNCPEETLTREYLQSGYRETVEGLEESREIQLSQIPTFTKPVILKCKEAIRKCHRAINESCALKRKAGQVYGAPLTSSLLTKPGVFPEQRPCGDDFRRKWIENLSQPHKRLRTLADHVPHGYRRKSLLEVLIRNNVPLLRATWFIKVTYLNQVRPGPAGILPEKTQVSRTEQWTKDIIEYLQYLLDEFVSRNTSPQTVYAGSLQKMSNSTSTVDSEEPSLHFKWWYALRILQWHHAEGLVFPSLIIDWVLNQLQEKELLGTLQLLLPIIYGVIESFVLSQTYVRAIVGLAVRFIQEPYLGGSDLVENSRRAYTTSAVVEMLRYLILAVPDSFVALDCFPLPPGVVSHVVNDGSFLSKAGGDAGRIKNDSLEVRSIIKDKGLDAHFQSLSIDRVVSSIQKRADTLAKAARPANPGNNVAKSVQELDKALRQGDVKTAYKFLFEDVYDGAADEGWISEVSPCLRSSLKWMGTVSLPFISSVFFLCEWATCDFRDFRAGSPHDLNFTGRKDFSPIHISIRLLKMKMRDIKCSFRSKIESNPGVNSLVKVPGQLNNYIRTSHVSVSDLRNIYRSLDGKHKSLSDIFQSPGPLHDIIVCWIDQHEALSREGFECLQHLIIELIRSGIFYPQAYIRQLIVSGVMDRNGPLVDRDRQKRHYKILKQLPASYIRDALEEARIAEMPILSEAMHIYSNERRLLLRGFIDQHKNSSRVNSSSKKQKHYPTSYRDGASPASVAQSSVLNSATSSFSVKNFNKMAELEDIKASISMLLHLPTSSSTYADAVIDESQGSVRRNVGSGNKTDMGEGTPGCEDCRTAKKQKLSEDRSSCFQGHSPNLSDDEDWWVRKGLKSLESFKADPPLKSTKQASRGRQKIVRKTQSLAQLAAARIESSQGASTSHNCDSRISCSHHKSSSEGEAPKSVDGIRTAHCGDVSIGCTLKQLRVVERKVITVWLLTLVRQLIEEIEKTTSKVGQYNRPLPSVDDKSSLRWRLGEDELSTILYLMDVSDDLVSAAKFLLWLLPKALCSSTSAIHGGRTVLVLPRNVGSQACEVGEAYVLSSIRRYENILVAADLIPETLSAAVHRAAKVMASNGRVSGSASLVYARYLLKKYGNVDSIVEWEKNFKGTCDKRLIAELDSGRSLDGEFGFPLGVPAGVEDLDDFLRVKISGVRVSRVGLSMREIVQRPVEDAFQYFYGKERKLFAVGSLKGLSLEKWDDGYQIAQQIVTALMDCIRQTGGAAQEGDPSLVSSAVSAIVNSIGLVIAKIPDLTASNNQLKCAPTSSSLSFARRILRIHITCLCLLKEALGERQSRVFEIALATEASTALGQAFTPVKAPRSQFQMSPETHDPNVNFANDILNNSTKTVLGRTAKITGAVSALVIGAVLHGVASLERMVAVFRLKEGLDVIQFVRSTKSNSNGNARSVGVLKVDNTVEVSAHWFRVLVGNCRTVCDGLILDLLGEASVVGLSRMQRTLPLKLVLPPAYSIFAFVIWRPFIFNPSTAAREDSHQLSQSLALAIDDAFKHLPFRDVCLRDSCGFYDLVIADSTDSEFAALLELSGPDVQFKTMAFVPLRARLFLNSIVDCKMPHSVFTQDNMKRVFGHGEAMVQYSENETKLLDKIVNVLDTLQPAKFHWQWIELRLLLNEQALIEKLDVHDTPLADAIRSLTPNPDKTAASENENNFIQIILTRLLVRPDAAPLFSEVVHLFGRSLEDSMLLQAKWFLAGHDVLFGRKSIRQRLTNIAESKGLSTKPQFRKPWGWCHSDADLVAKQGDKPKIESTSLEEGEVAEDGNDLKMQLRGFTKDFEGFNVSQQHVAERALIELVLPCIDQSSDESRNTFVTDLIKQMNNMEQHINASLRGAHKQSGIATSGTEVSASKGSNRKGIRGGSPGLARRASGTADIVPPSPAALRASLSLRLQFLLRLLPIIFADREPSSRNTRHMLASVILRLLGSRVVYDDADHSIYPTANSSLKKEGESSVEASAAAFVDFCGASLFDRLLLVLHGLLSSSRPSWMKSKPLSKSSNHSSKDSPLFDRDVAENLQWMQNELDRMQLPDTIRWRIQGAMPILFPSVRCSISCQPPSVPPSALSSLQPSISISGSNISNRNLVPSVSTSSNATGKIKTLPIQQDSDIETDPWTILEDGTGSGTSSSNTALIGSSDQANLKASFWLKGAIRVRRTDLTYIGAVDDDS